MNVHVSACVYVSVVFTSAHTHMYARMRVYVHVWVYFETLTVWPALVSHS